VSILSSRQSPPSPEEITVTILVRFWQEDDVWNASAWDLPVVVFGTTFEQARANFEDAILGHFETVCELGQIKETIQMLKDVEAQRSFYERIPPRQAFEKIVVNPRQLCFV